MEGLQSVELVVNFEHFTTVEEWRKVPAAEMLMKRLEGIQRLNRGLRLKIIGVVLIEACWRYRDQLIIWDAKSRKVVSKAEIVPSSL